MVSLTQLRALGLSRGQIRGLVRRGLLHPIHSDVFAYGHPKVAREGRLRAALLTCGSSSFLSHRTAAALWGVRNFNPYLIEVTVPATRRVARDGLRVHRTTDSHGVTTRAGLRLSSYARALIELAPTEPPNELERLITDGIRKGVLRVDAVSEALDRHARRPGVAKLARAFKDYRPKPNLASGLEYLFDDLITPTGLPEPERDVKVGGWELDFYWREYGVAVELDGRPYHIAVRDQEKDKYKDTKLALMGIVVIRITEHRLLAEPAAVLADVCALLALHGLPAG